MDVTTNLFIVAGVIIVGLIAQFIFRKLRIPDVLLLILFGAFLSQAGLAQGVREGGPAITFIITFALIYVIFYGALPIRIQAIFSTAKYAFLSSILNFIVITGVLGLAARMIGFNWVLGFSLGALFCVMDGSIINALLETIKLSKNGEAQVQTESAIIDVLVIVGVLSITNFAAMTFNEVLRNLTNYLLLSMGIGLVAGIIWAFALREVGQYSSAAVSTVAVLVLLYAFAEYIGANGVITIFTFAILLGNLAVWKRLLSKDQAQSAGGLTSFEIGFFRDISFVIRSFLFVYLGMLVDLSAWPWLVAGLGFFLIAYLLRGLVMHLVVNPVLTSKDRYLVEAMCAKGLTTTVIIAVIKADVAFTNIVIGGIVSSIVVTGLLVFLIDHGRFTSVWDSLAPVLKKARS